MEATSPKGEVCLLDGWLAGWLGGVATSADLPELPPPQPPPVGPNHSRLPVRSSKSRTHAPNHLLGTPPETTKSFDSECQAIGQLCSTPSTWTRTQSQARPPSPTLQWASPLLGHLRWSLYADNHLRGQLGAGCAPSSDCQFQSVDGLAART